MDEVIDVCGDSNEEDDHPREHSARPKGNPAPPVLQAATQEALDRHRAAFPEGSLAAECFLILRDAGQAGMDIPAIMNMLKEDEDLKETKAVEVEDTLKGKVPRQFAQFCLPIPAAITAAQECFVKLAPGRYALKALFTEEELKQTRAAAKRGAATWAPSTSRSIVTG